MPERISTGEHGSRPRSVFATLWPIALGAAALLTLTFMQFLPPVRFWDNACASALVNRSAWGVCWTTAIVILAGAACWQVVKATGRSVPPSWPSPDSVTSLRFAAFVVFVAILGPWVTNLAGQRFCPPNGFFSASASERPSPNTNGLDSQGRGNR